MNVCSVPEGAPPMPRGNYCCVRAVSPGPATRGELIACLLLRLLRQPGEKKRLQFLRLLESSSSLSARALPTVGLQQMVPTVNSKTIDMSNTMKSDALWLLSLEFLLSSKPLASC